MSGVRYIVTGINSGGKSEIACERHLPMSNDGSVDLWRDPQRQAGSQEFGVEGARFYPPPQGSILRLLTLTPASDPLEPGDLTKIADQFFDGFGIPECRVDSTRHPLMHQTPTLDYAILLSGELTLILETGDPIVLKPMDIVVQRETAHAWVNTGEGPATLLVAMLGHKAQ